MKICRFDEDRIGIVSDDRVHDVTDEVTPLLSQNGRGDALVAALPEVIRAAPGWLGEARQVPISEVVLRSPVSSPTKIVAAPVNYTRHVAEANADAAIRYGHTETDIAKAGLFLKANSSLAGAREPLRLRFADRRTDHEVELVAVIGKAGSDIPLTNALSHVAGYATGLDVTLRGPEDRSFRKSIDGYSVIGPWLVTADEIADPDDLELSLSVNGEVRQSANTRDTVYGVARLIEFASSFYTLHPGDLIYTGTPEGVGPVVAGDRIEADVQGLGTIDISVEAHIADPGGPA